MVRQRPHHVCVSNQITVVTLCHTPSLSIIPGCVIDSSADLSLTVSSPVGGLQHLHQRPSDQP